MEVRNRVVAVYARVSSEKEEQLSALENQKQYYQNLLDAHKEWTLYKFYVDEGITGTSVRKRKSFLEMIDDAVAGKFDLIITREVSRFARNTVDTLQQVRLLKKHGVEVYFTEDNIWTLNDEDGELRLTIMATLAQNESKKISMRVKAGQTVAFQNGVLLGSGNILGYDKAGNSFVINEEQAKTVRMIYNMYLDGKGTRSIQYELERLGRRTTLGRTVWHLTTISRILRNPFYCGTIVYRKSCVPDYLEQKKVLNSDDSTKIVVEGTHTAIVSRKEFQKVQEIMAARSCKSKGQGTKTRGVKVSDCVWVRKLVCSCGANFRARRVKKDYGMYIRYMCGKQAEKGTPRTRERLGLGSAGCDSQQFSQWKLDLMATAIFKRIWVDRDHAMDIANNLLEEYLKLENASNEIAERVTDLQKALSKQETKLDNLVEMRMSGEIAKETFLDKKQKVEAEIESLQKEISKCDNLAGTGEDDLKSRLERLRQSVLEEFETSIEKIPDEFIEELVEKIVVGKDYFIWYLRTPGRSATCKVEGTKKESSVSVDFNMQPNAEGIVKDKGSFAYADVERGGILFLVPDAK